VIRDLASEPIESLNLRKSKGSPRDISLGSTRRGSINAEAIAHRRDEKRIADLSPFASADPRQPIYIGITSESPTRTKVIGDHGKVGTQRRGTTLRKKLGLFAAVVVATILSVGGTAPAFASDNVVDDESSNSVQNVCSSGWKWLILEKEYDGKMLIGATQANFNGTASPAQATFTSTASGTFTATVHGSSNLGIDAKLASASTTFGASFSGSLTASLGNSITITVPPQSWGMAEYGIWTSYVRGEEQYWQGIGTVCNITQTNNSWLYAPFRAGWDTWTDTPL